MSLRGYYRLGRSIQTPRTSFINKKGAHMKCFRLMTLPVILGILVAAYSTAFADSHADTIALFKQSPAVQPFFDSSYGYAVFPMVGKGAIIFGATYGKGKVYRGGTATGTAELNKMTVGFQLGGRPSAKLFFSRTNALTMNLPRDPSTLTSTLRLWQSPSVRRPAPDPWVQPPEQAPDRQPAIRPAVITTREWPLSSMPRVV